jgi:hypothetical protein
MTCCSNQHKFITEDAMETTSHFIQKIDNKHNMIQRNIHAWRRWARNLIKERSMKVAETSNKS